MQLVLTNKNFWTEIVIPDTINRVLDWSTLKVWVFGARIYQNPNREEHGKIRNPKRPSNSAKSTSSGSDMSRFPKRLLHVDSVRKTWQARAASSSSPCHNSKHLQNQNLTKSFAKQQKTKLEKKKGGGGKKTRRADGSIDTLSAKFIELARNPQTFGIATTFSPSLKEKSTIIRVLIRRALDRWKLVLGGGRRNPTYNHQKRPKKP